MSKEYLLGETIETIYLGGGTPSLLEQHDLDRIFNTLYKLHRIDLKECTIEVNPDDLSEEKNADPVTTDFTPLNTRRVGSVGPSSSASRSRRRSPLKPPKPQPLSRELTNPVERLVWNQR